MTKKTIILFFSILIWVSCNSDHGSNENDETTSPESQKISEAKLTGHYGEKITLDNTIPAKEIVNKMHESDSLPMKVEGQILSTCKMKGCWMNIALEGDQKMRVTFKNYSFFVPKSGVEGKTAIVQGYAKKVTTNVETQKHFAKDAGKSDEEIDAITEPKDEIAFVATGVIIK